MLYSAELALSYADKRTEQEMSENRMLADAIERRIEIIG